MIDLERDIANSLRFKNFAKSLDFKVKLNIALRIILIERTPNFPIE